MEISTHATLKNVLQTPTTNNQVTSLAEQQQFNATLQASLTDQPQQITIQSGDTLSALALKYHTTVANLAQINNIANPDLIYAGNHLTITSLDKPQASASQATNTPTASTSITTSQASPSTLNDDETSARAYIVSHESGGSYTARNGRYIGKYQLDRNYLNGDFSPANQEIVAQNYVMQRYGSWVNAMSHWKIHHWY